MRVQSACSASVYFRAGRCGFRRRALRSLTGGDVTTRGGNSRVATSGIWRAGRKHSGANSDGVRLGRMTNRISVIRRFFPSQVHLQTDVTEGADLLYGRVQHVPPKVPELGVWCPSATPSTFFHQASDFHPVMAGVRSSVTCLYLRAVMLRLLSL